MSIRQGLLAILDLGPSYGYQLRAEFDRRTGSTWPINAGQIYSTLDRLERDGLVRKADIDADGQVYFEITDAGHSVSRSWWSTPVERSIATRDELAIKIAVSVTLPGVDVGEVIDAQRAATLATLRGLESTRDSTGEPRSVEALTALLVLDSMVFAAEAELRWLGNTEHRLSSARATGAARQLPLTVELPKRGRPFAASVPAP